MTIQDQAEQLTAFIDALPPTTGAHWRFTVSHLIAVTLTQQLTELRKQVAQLKAEADDGYEGMHVYDEVLALIDAQGKAV